MHYYLQVQPQCCGNAPRMFLKVHILQYLCRDFEFHFHLFSQLIRTYLFAKHTLRGLMADLLSDDIP